MNKTILIIITVFVVLAGAFLVFSFVNKTNDDSQDQEEIIITRDLSNFKNFGEEFNVVLDVSIKDVVAGVGIEEYVPEGATIINSLEKDYKIVGNKIEFLLFESEGIKSKKITYSAILDSKGSFQGNWISAAPKLKDSIIGDVSV